MNGRRRVKILCYCTLLQLLLENERNDKLRWLLLALLLKKSQTMWDTQLKY
jgi:hypothetical protein